MDAQKPLNNPVPSVPTSANPPKTGFSPVSVIIIVIFAVLLTTVFTFLTVKAYPLLFSPSPNPSPAMTADPQPVTPTGYYNAKPTVTDSKDISSIMIPTDIPCDVSDRTFCLVISDLKSALREGNYSGLLDYQKIQPITCDPDGMFVQICEGASKGTVKEGYAIGYNQSEGVFLSGNDYILTVSRYVDSNSPFNYRGSVLSGDKAVAVFLNNSKDHLVAFPMRRAGGTWRMDTLILGGTFGDASFENLSDSLLDFVR